MQYVSTSPKDPRLTCSSLPCVCVCVCFLNLGRHCSQLEWLATYATWDDEHRSSNAHSKPTDHCRVCTIVTMYAAGVLFSWFLQKLIIHRTVGACVAVAVDGWNHHAIRRTRLDNKKTTARSTRATEPPRRQPPPRPTSILHTTAAPRQSHDVLRFTWLDGTRCGRAAALVRLRSRRGGTAPASSASGR